VFDVQTAIAETFGLTSTGTAWKRAAPANT
jgi:hypothetical protein